MATVRVSVQAAEITDAGFRTAFSLGRTSPDGFRVERDVEVRSTGEVMSAMSAMAEELGVDCVGTVRVVAGRAPNGLAKEFHRSKIFTVGRVHEFYEKLR